MANVRALTASEQLSVETLRKLGLECTLLFLTEDAINKSRLDVEFSLLQMLQCAGVHHSVQQGQRQGQEVVVPARWIQSDRLREIEVFHYNPESKQGSHGLWVVGLKTMARSGDVVAVFVARGVLHFLDMTLYPIELAAAKRIVQSSFQSDMDHRPIAPVVPIGVHQEGIFASLFWEVPDPIGRGVASYLSSLRQGASSRAASLLEMLRSLAMAGPLAAVCSGPTAVGRTIERALGIDINSDRAPDLFGIEIKSARTVAKGDGTRLTLFACVPDWAVSRCKSSSQILDAYGYDSGVDRRLYCEVSIRRVNSQGLYFDLDSRSGVLCEKRTVAVDAFGERCVTVNDEEVAAWPFARLEQYLHAKHKETFWVKAKVLHGPSGESFQLESVEHTVRPSSSQFFQLLRDDVVTMDHLIKRKDGKVCEKGPLFKIERGALDQLFPGGVRHYHLC